VACNTQRNVRNANQILFGKPLCSVSQPPGRGPVPGPSINYTGPREA